MNNLKKAAEMALDVFDGPVLKDATEQAMRLRKACDLLRQALAQPEQEPEAWYDKHGMITHDPFEGITPLYTSPPRCEWVNLTKEDMPDGDNPMFDTNEFYAGMAWAAAKLKEKNT